MPSPGQFDGGSQAFFDEEFSKKFAHEFARTHLAGVQQVWDGIRRQYQEHSSLLTRQEIILKQLSRNGSGKLGDMSPTASDDIGYANVCGFCQQHGKSGRHDILADEVASFPVVALPRPVFGEAEGQVAVVVPVPMFEDASFVTRALDRELSEKSSRSCFASKMAKASETDRMVAKMLNQDPLPPLAEENGFTEDNADLSFKSNADVWEEDIAQASTVNVVAVSEAAKVSTSLSFREPEEQEVKAEESEGPKRASRPTLSDALKNSQKIKRASKKGAKGMMGEMGLDRASLDQMEYSVESYYYEKGICQWIARSDLFMNITLAVIGSNAIYIGIDADNNNAKTLAQADLIFQICENSFCAFFTFEWIVRFGSFAKKFNCMRDMWFKFDSALVILMIVETWLMPIFFTGTGGTGIPTGLVKLLRLLRLARMARLTRALPDLVAMIKGVRQASRAVGSALLLLVLLIYVASIVMFTLLKDSDNVIIHSRFHRLGVVMWTLLLDGTFMDNIGNVVRPLLETESYPATIVFMIFVLGSALTVMNMLIGVLCEVVSAVAASEKEDGQIRMVKDRLLCLLRDLDEDGSGQISRDEIQMVINNEDAIQVLEDLQVDLATFISQLDMYYESGEDLSIHQIMDLILMLRQDRAPTVKDILHTQTFSRWQLNMDMKKITASLDDVKNECHEIEGQLTDAHQEHLRMSSTGELDPAHHLRGFEWTQSQTSADMVRPDSLVTMAGGAAMQQDSANLLEDMLKENLGKAENGHGGYCVSP